MAIRSTRGKLAAAMLARVRTKALADQIAVRANEKFALIGRARRIEDLRAPPGNRLELLSGDRRGQWSIRVNDQWRICFRWEEGHAYEVEIIDYH